MRSIIVPVVVAMAALLNMSCDESGAGSLADGSVTAAVPFNGLRVSEIVDLDTPFQITYRQSGPEPPKTDGMSIWRQWKGVLRWDSSRSPDSPPGFGSIGALRTVGGRTEAFGCLWFSLSADRAEVTADCGTGGGGGFDVLWELALLAPLFDEQADDRHILDQDAHCYRNRYDVEICVNDARRVLFFDAADYSYEATEIASEVEPFDFPYETQDGLTPTAASDGAQPASRFDLPVALGFAP
jgi:hypothetical protein